MDNKPQKINDMKKKERKGKEEGSEKDGIHELT